MTFKSTHNVSAVVVTWNSCRDIRACLNSLRQQTVAVNKIVMVDNYSTDGTPDIVESEYPEITVIRNSDNLGFAQGNNVGISMTDSEWIMALNPDARLETDWLERIFSFTDSLPPEESDKIGMLGGILLREPESDDTAPIIDSLGIEIFTSRRVRDEGMGNKLSDIPPKPWKVFGICAAAALYSRKMLEDVRIDGEYFASMFTSYYEDADLAWRAWRRNWSAWLVPVAIGYHKRGGSPTGSKYSRYLTHRNRMWLIARNEPLSNLWKDPGTIFVHEALMLLRILRYPYLLKAVWEAIMGLRKAVADFKSLPTKNAKSPAFRKGIGFSRQNFFAATSVKK